MESLISYINAQPDIDNVDNVGENVFSSLKNAREMLRLILLQNHHLSSAQFSHVLDMFEVDFLSPTNNNLEVIINDSFQVSHQKGIFKTLSTIKNELLTNMNYEDQQKSQESSFGLEFDFQSTTSVCFEVVGRLLWQDMQNRNAEILIGNTSCLLVAVSCTCNK